MWIKLNETLRSDDLLPALRRDLDLWIKLVTMINLFYNLVHLKVPVIINFFKIHCTTFFNNAFFKCTVLNLLCNTSPVSESGVIDLEFHSVGYSENRSHCKIYSIKKEKLMSI